jgi:hypothetical protein
VSLAWILFFSRRLPNPLGRLDGSMGSRRPVVFHEVVVQEVRLAGTKAEVVDAGDG